jgi:pimeloyl-ACP methyl ester carboxylesterase
MTPFYFGTARRRLFGIYEPAAPIGRGKRAAVLCHPWGDEYIYAHRAIRQLAVRLTGAGIDTLRFDFFGTGDSGGEMVDADLAIWEADIELAMEELRNIVGSTRTTLIGLRLGATLAARVAALHPKDVDSLVLWDPVLSGADYPVSLGTASATPDATLEIRGFPLTARMRRDLQAIALTQPFAPPGIRGLTIVTDRSATPVSPAEAPRGNGEQSYAIEFRTAVPPWIEDPNKMGAVPVEVIRRIVDWLG